MSVNYFEWTAEQARMVNARIQADKGKDDLRCPSCGGDINFEQPWDATCGSPHCREAWYGEIWERK